MTSPNQQMYNSLQLAISNFDKDNLESYQNVANHFQKLVESEIQSIWLKHNYKINLELNNVKLGLVGSTINGSTAIGYIMEEFLTRQLDDTIFQKPMNSTINSLYDFKYLDDSKIELMVNLKSEKNTSSNNAICAGTILVEHYLANNKPKLYLILKSCYSIDEQESIINISDSSSVFMESFLLNGVSSDNRSWSKEFNPLSGRIQTPSKTKMKQFSNKSIPYYDHIESFIRNFAQRNQ